MHYNVCIIIIIRYYQNHHYHKLNITDRLSAQLCHKRHEVRAFVATTAWFLLTFFPSGRVLFTHLPAIGGGGGGGGLVG